MDRLTAMEMFVRVVMAKSFSGAARQLGVSKSVVSKAVAELEDRLGAQLLNRTTRQMSLTEMGQSYYDRCITILEQVEETEHMVSSSARCPRGVLRVSAPVTFSVLNLGWPLSEFMAQYPDVSLELALNDRVVDIVEEGFDLAIRISRRLKDSNLIAVKLGSARTITCASPSYLQQFGEPQHPRDLLQHHCLRYSNLGPAQEWSFRDPETGEPIQIAVSGRITANNGEVLRAAAVKGEGIIAGPSFLAAEDICQGRLVPILTKYAAPPFGIYAVYPPNRHVSAKVRRLVDFLKGLWGDAAPWEKACGDCPNGK
ncbi:LysR family transcriptional regulator [Pedomonas mirosovicensis]|uniref:LysR family transcriptional regulator n=1 Tax=Pedomonas mirosovicensis TaxID=2908641 RepID=UPI00216720E9|nr:LysR family transcriptional regulator [Pedomonas mirosovicensis]MCH8683754.1 LysR family transcriptional regulator [Pedomonas mirosovicensis]